MWSLVSSTNDAKCLLFYSEIEQFHLWMCGFVVEQNQKSINNE